MTNRDKYIPWLVVGLSGAILATVGRYIALSATQDVGSANLTFVIVFIATIVIAASGHPGPAWQTFRPLTTNNTAQFT